MKRVSLVATKTLRYGTRRLRAGDTFDAARQDARALVATGLAADAPRQVYETKAPDPILAPAPVQPTPAPVEPQIADLRTRYEAVTGKKPHHRWGVARLKGEIAAAKSQADAEATDE